MRRCAGMSLRDFAAEGSLTPTSVWAQPSCYTTRIMPPLLWTILEILFGLWVFRNRQKIQRSIAHLILPPPLETATLPDCDQNPDTAGFLVIGAIVGSLVGVGLSFVFPSSYISAGSLCGIFLGTFIAYRRDFYRLAPNQPWRVLTESLAARAGIQNVAVCMARSKSRQIRVSPKGVVTLPSALLRNSTPDELTFHIGRALWEIQSGYVRKEYGYLVRCLLGIALLLIPLTFPWQTATTPVALVLVLVSASTIYQALATGRREKIRPDADRFALGLTGDLSTAVRVIEAEEERRAASNADIRYGLRARQNGYERAKRLSEWWATQKGNVSPAAQATAQVQRLGKP